jgi:hypothetical protein
MIWGLTPIIAITSATAIALVMAIAFTKQGGIQRFEMKFDRNGGYLTIEGREDVPPKLSEKPESLKP